MIPSGWPPPEESQQVEMGGFRQGIPPADNSEATHAGREIRTIPGVEHPVVVGEAETQQGPSRRRAGGGLSPLPPALSGQARREADNSSRNTSRIPVALESSFHPPVHGQRRAYETDLPEHLPYPPASGLLRPAASRMRWLR